MATAITDEIPKASWQDYFRLLAKQYQGWAVTIELLAGELGDQPVVQGLPLQGISYDPVGSQAGDILVEMGDAGMPFETHLVHKPRVVRVAMTQPGTEADIEIESEEGVTTLVRIRRRPELPPAPGNP
jgi:hypothetical protein